MEQNSAVRRVPLTCQTLSQLVHGAFWQPQHLTTRCKCEWLQVVTTVTLTNPVPNLTLGISGALPDQSSGKVLVCCCFYKLWRASAMVLVSM